MAKVPPKNQPNDVRLGERNGVRITGIRYVPAPDAETRFSRAIDVLLGAATKSVTPLEDGSSGLSHQPQRGRRGLKEIRGFEKYESLS